MIDSNEDVSTNREVERTLKCCLMKQEEQTNGNVLQKNSSEGSET